MSAWAQGAAAGAAMSGWLMWALSVERHRRLAALPQTTEPARARWAAAGLLALAVAIAIADDGLSIGVLASLAWLSTTGFATVLVLAWLPRRSALVMRISVAALAASGIAWLA